MLHLMYFVEDVEQVLIRLDFYPDSWRLLYFYFGSLDWDLIVVYTLWVWYPYAGIDLEIEGYDFDKYLIGSY